MRIHSRQEYKSQRCFWLPLLSSCTKKRGVFLASPTHGMSYDNLLMTAIVLLTWGILLKGKKSYLTLGKIVPSRAYASIVLLTMTRSLLHPTPNDGLNFWQKTIVLYVFISIQEFTTPARGVTSIKFNNCKLQEFATPARRITSAPRNQKEMWRYSNSTTLSF